MLGRNRFCYKSGKRILDLILSIAGILFLLPLFLTIPILIKFYDRGPVFYKASRVGYNGIVFRMFKFRTMIVDADKAGPSSASISDSRITPIGSYMRKYKLDEIPQLINVLKGDMSLVGPRPEEKKFTDLYNDSELLILSVKPGITDWASIWNSNEGEILEGADDPDGLYMELIRPEKIRLQLKYVKNHNFFIDLRIIFLTVKKIILRK